MCDCLLGPFRARAVANGAVEAVPQLRSPAIAPAALIIRCFPLSVSLLSLDKYLEVSYGRGGCMGERVIIRSFPLSVSLLSLYYLEVLYEGCTGERVIMRSSPQRGARGGPRLRRRVRRLLAGPRRHSVNDRPVNSHNAERPRTSILVPQMVQQLCRRGPHYS